MRASMIRVAVAAALFTLSVSAAAAQEKRRTLEVEALAGYTAVNMERWAGTSDGFQLEDWSQGGGGLTARVFFRALGAGRAHLGVEYGWQHLLWFEARAYGGTDFNGNIIWYYPDYSSNAHHLNGLVRLAPSAKLRVDLGAGLYFFDGFVDPALHVSARYPLFERATGSMPIGIRIDPILDSDAVMIPVSLTLGFSTRF